MIKLILKTQSNHPDYDARHAQIQFTLYSYGPERRLRDELLPVLETEWHVEISRGEPGER